MEQLSARRRRILTQILPAVVPSTYGDKRFGEIDSNWTPGCGYTTCGGLPAYVSNHIGQNPSHKKRGYGLGGLIGMRNAALRFGAWVHHDPAATQASIARGEAPKLPRPGDYYLLCSGRGHNTGCNHIAPTSQKMAWRYKGATIEHVGVIVEAKGELWRTADAGQGYSKVTQQALYMFRRFNAATGRMTGEVGGKGRPMRRLCGWVNIDAFPFADGQATVGAGPQHVKWWKE